MLNTKSFVKRMLSGSRRRGRRTLSTDERGGQVDGALPKTHKQRKLGIFPEKILEKFWGYVTEVLSFGV